MEVADVAPALQERLGPEATAGLVQLFDIARQEWTAEVTTAAVERFERRLIEETGSLRLELHDSVASLRTELHDSVASLRAELHDSVASLRTELRDSVAALRQDNLAGRAELIKWSVAFWFSQVIAVATIVGIMLQMMQR